MVPEFEPRIGSCAGSVEPAWDSLSLPLSAPALLVLSLSLSLSFKINKLKKNFKKGDVSSPSLTWAA